jgi:hypothetical protein
MTRTSGIVLQILVAAIFGSAMFFLALAVSREAAAMPGMSTYEAMGVPGPRQYAEDTMELAPRFDSPRGFVRASHDEEVALSDEWAALCQVLDNCEGDAVDNP